jgi:NAD(P)-dependent dehydrogenase (short-subunit alcohol dehydrogenase family)
MGRLADKNILITGGNSGIGLAAAQEFDREGARVAICGLNEGSLQRAKETLGAGSLAVRADVSNLTDLDTMRSNCHLCPGRKRAAARNDCKYVA